MFALGLLFLGVGGQPSCRQFDAELSWEGRAVVKGVKCVPIDALYDSSGPMEAGFVVVEDSLG